jgi:hypothetical protein
VFFLASDGPLTPDIAGRLEAIGIHPRLVNRHYLGAMLSADRLADIERAIAVPAEANTDLSPALYYYELRRWLSQFDGVSALAGAILALAMAAYLAALRPAPRVIFAAGFAASGLEMVLLLGFQVLYGSVYRQIGLVFTVFMAGLAAGAWAATRSRLRLSPGASVPIAGLAIAAFSAALPLLLRAAAFLDEATGAGAMGQGCLLSGAFLLAGLVGAQFSLAGAAAEGAVPASLFGADLAGAALGALLVSSILIPRLGVTTVCLLTAGLNAAAAAIALAVRRCLPLTSSA